MHRMKPAVRNSLNLINRDFYARFAEMFSEMRSEDAYEAGRILVHITPSSRVLDVGCGNGRLSLRLVRSDNRFVCLGIDSCEELVAIATEAATKALGPKEAPRLIFKSVDILDMRWIDEARKASGLECFDVILMIAVLHHVPGKEERVRILSQARDLLSVGGRIILSAWQFPESERMREKIVPWSTLGFDEEDLEPGDSLIVWKRGGIGYRYCHWINSTELEELAKASGLALLETFRFGGYEGNLSLCGILSAM
jgi:tRNA (uracil-5-)-methyltransferase TRM9